MDGYVLLPTSGLRVLEPEFCTSTDTSPPMLRRWEPRWKQHLAAVRVCFDWLVTGGMLSVNPAHAVRGAKHVVKRGNTPVPTTDQARELLDSIDTSTLVGLRDRALIAVMTYITRSRASGLWSRCGSRIFCQR